MSLDRCIRFVVLVLLLMTASGCSGIHPYRNDLAPANTNGAPPMAGDPTMPPAEPMPGGAPPMMPPMAA
jgi:hypothetical protein